MGLGLTSLGLHGVFQSKTGVISSSGDWKLDPAELESKFSTKTKLIILNTPNNPLGKVCIMCAWGDGG